MNQNPFLGRSLTAINDFTKDELFYLFKQTRVLKKAWQADDDKALDRFRINSSKIGMYEIFTESSTRTLESFKNAAEFHNINYKTLDVDHSSLKTKNESYAHTLFMLMGYNNNQVFVLRTKEEGVCRWLKIAFEKYVERNGIRTIPPLVINGGDGKHKHPTQLILDLFTFLEANNWQNNYIHLAQIGDLKYGRTVHSQVDGLKVFNNVKIDLIAPKELKMPELYLEKMNTNNFKIRTFSSLQEYIGQDDIADKWYFTRPQRERMDPDTKAKMITLQPLISFDKQFTTKVPEGKVKFYHPLPINKDNPVIPSWVDETGYNGYEKQSINGFLTRIILLAAVTGKIGDDFEGEPYEEPEYVENFIKPIKIEGKEQKNSNEGIRPIIKGTVIDKICKEDNIDIPTLKNYLNKIDNVMNFGAPAYPGRGYSRNDGKLKGFFFLPENFILEPDKKKLAAMAPNCILNVIKDSKVVTKELLELPPRIYNIEQLECKNPDCITNFEPAYREFTRHKSNGKNIFICAYCDWPHSYKEIWR